MTLKISSMSKDRFVFRHLSSLFAYLFFYCVTTTCLGPSLQVKVWFQNRRTKHKRDREREEERRQVEAESLATKSLLQILQPTQDSPTVCTNGPSVQGLMRVSAGSVAALAPVARGSLLGAQTGSVRVHQAAAAACHTHARHVDYRVLNIGSAGCGIDPYFQCQPQYGQMPHVRVPAPSVRYQMYPYMSHGMTWWVNVRGSDWFFVIVFDSFCFLSLYSWFVRAFLFIFFCLIFFLTFLLSSSIFISCPPIAHILWLAFLTNFT